MPFRRCLVSIKRVAICPLPGRRYGAERRLPYGKEDTMNASIALMLALVLLLMVIDRMRR